MIRTIILITLVLLSFSGCCVKEYVYVDKIVKMNVPVPCVIADVNCSISGNDIKKVAGLHACILYLREASEKCQ